MSNRAGRMAELMAESQRHYAAYSLFNQAMAEHLGLHPTDLQCVALLDLEPGPVTTGELAALTGLTPSATSRLVDRLEKAGFVVRHTDPGDRRRALVSLVPRTCAAVAEAWEVPGRAFAEVLGDYDDDQLQLIADYLRRAADVGREQARRLSDS
ncbi:MarR family winged helix-turn-helix transcriptional regulator [Nonomuraea longicatena]